jgi:hypothetical protein
LGFTDQFRSCGAHELNDCKINNGVKMTSEPIISNDENYNFFDEFDDPIQGWNSKFMRKILVKNWVEYLGRTDWTTFLTLTFREECIPEKANRLFRLLIRRLNEELLGKNYRNYVDHSYFSYCKGIEYQRRGIIHFHVLIDRPVHYKLIHDFWDSVAGFAWTTVIKQDINAITYVSKYASKDGEVEPYFAKIAKYTPMEKPIWWLASELSILQRPKNNL